MSKEAQIRQLLNQHRGKIFSVTFIKRTTGEVRKMVARQAVKNGQQPLKGGEWANGSAGKAIDHNLVLVTDMQLEQAGKYSRRSIPLDAITELRIGGETFTF